MLDPDDLSTARVDKWLLHCGPPQAATPIVPWLKLRRQWRAAAWGAVALLLTEATTLRATETLRVVGREHVPTSAEVQQHFRSMGAWLAGGEEPKHWHSFVQMLYAAAERVHDRPNVNAALLCASEQTALVADAVRELAGAAGQPVAENPWPRPDGLPERADSYTTRAVELLALAQALATHQRALDFEPKPKPNWLVPVEPSHPDVCFARDYFLSSWWHIVRCLDQGTHHA